MVHDLVAEDRKGAVPPGVLLAEHVALVTHVGTQEDVEGIDRVDGEAEVEQMAIIAVIVALLGAAQVLRIHGELGRWRPRDRRADRLSSVVVLVRHVPALQHVELGRQRVGQGVVEAEAEVLERNGEAVQIAVGEVVVLDRLDRLPADVGNEFTEVQS